MEELLPHMRNEMLIYYGNRKPLGNLLVNLHAEILKRILKECKYISKKLRAGAGPV